MKKNIFSSGSFSLLIGLLLFLAGLYYVAFGIMAPDFSRIPGDMADARLNNYFLEHGYKFLTGKTPGFWNAPFIYPEKNIITYSDNLIGTAPLYALFRGCGADLYTAYQLWILLMFVLNFAAAAFVFCRLSGHRGAAMIGAYIFAFGLSFIASQINHAQVFPRFMIPLVLYWLLRFFDTQQVKYCAWAFFGISYQFYCGIYLGFLLLLAVLFFFVVKVARVKSFIRWLRTFRLKKALFSLLFVLLAIASMLPLLYPYYLRSLASGLRSYDDVKGSIPHIVSYFYTEKGTFFWDMLSQTGNGLPNPWDHWLFPGAIVVVCFFVFPFWLYRTRRSPETANRFTLYLCLLLLLLFVMQANGKSLYVFIYAMPGFSSMRSMGRIIDVELFFFAALVALLLAALLSRVKYKNALLAALALVCFTDQFLSPSSIATFSKSVSEQRVAAIKEKLEKGNYKAYKAFAYMPDGDADNSDFIQIDAMLASQAMDIPTINGYTAIAPDVFDAFWRDHDAYSLQRWLAKNNMDIWKDRILLIK